MPMRNALATQGKGRPNMLHFLHVKGHSETGLTAGYWRTGIPLFCNSQFWKLWECVFSFWRHWTKGKSPSNKYIQTVLQTMLGQIHSTGFHALGICWGSHLRHSAWPWQGEQLRTYLSWKDIRKLWWWWWQWNGSTLITLLTHTIWSQPQTMGYRGVWHMRVLTKKNLFFLKKVARSLY